MKIEQKGKGRQMKDKRLNRDIIKYMAMLTMLLNHIGNVLMKGDTWLRTAFIDIGYFTAITMCYFLVEGYRYTRSKRKYAKRLAWFAVLSQIPFCLALSEGTIIRSQRFNMFYTLLLCFGIVYVYDRMTELERRKRYLIVLFLLSAFGDWAFIAPIFTVFFVEANNDRNLLKIAYVKSIVIFWIINFLTYVAQYDLLQTLIRSTSSTLGVALSAVVILYCYNGKRVEKGKVVSKWFFYLFYPVHLLILGLIRIGMMR